MTTNNKDRGYIVDVISENEKKKFECLLCLAIIKEATHGCKKHVFCKDCIHDYIKSIERKEDSEAIQIKCPAGCGHTFNKKELISSDIVDQFVNQIACRCKDCDWNGELLDFLQVHGVKCLEKEVPCQLCSTVLKRKDMDHHLKDVCTHRPMVCRGCQKNFPFVDHSKHEESCDDIKVECSFKNFGCNVQETRRNMIAHESDSCQQHLSFMAKYFSDKNKQLKEETKQLKEENKQLEVEKNQLQEETKQLKEENIQLKEATKQLKGETKQLKEESKQLKEETKQLKEETKQLKEETKQLKEETKQLKVEKNQLQEENKQSKEETKQSKKETKQSKEETKQLKEETKQLKEETKQLKGETKQLKEENKQVKVETNQLKEETKQFKEETKQLKEETKQLKEENKQLKKKVELLETNIEVLKWNVNIQQIILKEPVNKYFHFPAADEMHIKNIVFYSDSDLFNCFSINNFTWIIERLAKECDVLNNYKQELNELFSSIKTIKMNTVFGGEHYFFQIDDFKFYKCKKFSIKKIGNILYIEKNNNRNMWFYISKWMIYMNMGMMQIDITKLDERFKVFNQPHLSSKYFCVRCF